MGGVGKSGWRFSARRRCRALVEPGLELVLVVADRPARQTDAPAARETRSSGAPSPGSRRAARRPLASSGAVRSSRGFLDAKRAASAVQHGFRRRIPGRSGAYLDPLAAAFTGRPGSEASSAGSRRRCIPSPLRSTSSGRRRARRSMVATRSGTGRCGGPGGGRSRRARRPRARPRTGSAPRRDERETCASAGRSPLSPQISTDGGR